MSSRRGYRCDVSPRSQRGAGPGSRGGVLVWADGRVVEGAVGGLSAPTILVVPVTDALKRVSTAGVVEGSVDRDATWMIAAYYLDASTVRDLGADVGDVDTIHQMVTSTGRDWEARSLDDVL